ncbi:methyltransferase domain-containing protein [Halorubrum sp. ASP1]|jgi:release factor glutamine methyltransferase|uniref:HemK2/MTQ2 family protein methyltransferase n=1 Tax=unclassified Halorubrum TaxID=2642239 RepID=UPI000EF1EC9D|nr:MULTISPECIES: HemK2/MTQ2 family protein methyltransferase [unclassified Halorubrum]RLM50525.1 methyltransferase domain-containing protein [Halorubrum sp. Atlit-28R]TKX58310.1 methyltransferase domain-containing protein [Halorubrum sp. ASP1]
MSGDGSGGGDGLAARRGADDAVVYQPAEDSGLLAEAAVAEAHGRVLEVGTGSGWVAERVAEERGLDVVGSDLNPHAARQARERGVEAVVADLLSPFRADAFDTVCFNPPYLPTDPDNEWDDWMEHALSGGESGRELIEPFLADVGRALAPDGVVLLLVSSLTGYDEVLGLVDEAGFAAEPVVEESFPFETLTVLALRRA